MYRLSLELANSELRDGFGGVRDRLDDPGWRGRLLSRVGWQDFPDAEARERAEALRRLIRRVVLTVARGETVSADDADAFNDCLRRSPLVTYVSRERGTLAVRRRPVADDWDAALAAFVRDFVDLLAETDPARIKVCANALCQWAFVDESRNRSRRWCHSSACGNVERVRRHRARHA
jgi:predicted RNA-binding Zn ribbon-like protein